METINVTIRGISPLLQNRFSDREQAQLSESSKRNALPTSSAEEWRDKAYKFPNGEIYQPATHIEGALVKAATNFKVQGRRGKTFKDAVKAAVFVKPDAIPHGISLNEELDNDPSKPLYIDERAVVIPSTRGRSIRRRLAFADGWTLSFQIQFNPTLVDFETLNRILNDAGEQVGIGDYRPRFGRFMVTKFEKVE